MAPERLTKVEQHDEGVDTSFVDMADGGFPAVAEAPVITPEQIPADNAALAHVRENLAQHAETARPVLDGEKIGTAIDNFVDEQHEARQSSNLEKFAEKLGVSKEYVDSIERGRRNGRSDADIARGILEGEKLTHKDSRKRSTERVALTGLSVTAAASVYDAFIGGGSFFNVVPHATQFLGETIPAGTAQAAPFVDAMYTTAAGAVGTAVLAGVLYGGMKLYHYVKERGQKKAFQQAYPRQ